MISYKKSHIKKRNDINTCRKSKDSICFIDLLKDSLSTNDLICLIQTYFEAKLFSLLPSLVDVLIQRNLRLFDVIQESTFFGYYNLLGDSKILLIPHILRECTLENSLRLILLDIDNILLITGQLENQIIFELQQKIDSMNDFPVFFSRWIIKNQYKLIFLLLSKNVDMTLTIQLISSILKKLGEEININYLFTFLINHIKKYEDHRVFKLLSIILLRWNMDISEEDHRYFVKCIENNSDMSFGMRKGANKILQITTVKMI